MFAAHSPIVNSPKGSPNVTNNVKIAISPKIIAPTIEKISIFVPPSHIYITNSNITKSNVQVYINIF